MVAKTTPWLKIKAEYLQGVTPRELALKYKVAAKSISDKAFTENWGAEKSKISENIRENSEDEIKRLTTKALSTLEYVLDDDSAKNSDKVSACKAILDISGLKSSKQEITGKDGEPLIVSGFASMEDAVKHFKEMIGE